MVKVKSNKLKKIIKQKATSTTVVALVALIGLLSLLVGNAATTSFPVEPSRGVITGSTINSTNDVTASNDDHVRFILSPTIVAAGDIACGTGCWQNQTANLIDYLQPDAVLPIGDNAYKCGTRHEFEMYYQSSWGRPSILDITYPVPGNHEYSIDATKCDDGIYPAKVAVDRGRPYRDFFISRLTTLIPDFQISLKRTWYKYTLGNWRIYALDSQCAAIPYGTNPDRNGCKAGSPQYDWLQAELEADAESPGRKCTMAYWHIPLSNVPVVQTPIPSTSSAEAIAEYNEDYDPQYDSNTVAAAAGSPSDFTALWRLLVQKKADIVLTGHAHSYIRYTPAIDFHGTWTPPPSGQGTTQIMVGTGGQPTDTHLRTDNNYPPYVAFTSDDFDCIPRLTRCGSGNTKGNRSPSVSMGRRGVLKAVLNSDNMEFEWISVANGSSTEPETAPGPVLDRGRVDCHL